MSLTVKSPSRFLFFPLIITAFISSSSSFTYNGFRSANLTLNGLAHITGDGLLRLSDDVKQRIGRAFYPTPLVFKNSEKDSSFSFSTTFVFAIVPDFQPLTGHGMAFVISPETEFPASTAGPYFGLFNETNNGNASNHVFAVELDTFMNVALRDINDNHVGVDINGLVSVSARPAAYFDNRTGSFQNLSLNSRQPIQAWVEYDSSSQRLNVTIAPLHEAKPRIPLLSLRYDLSPVLNRVMYVGFSCSPLMTSHYVLGWSFALNGVNPPPLDLSKIPKLPRFGPKKPSKFMTLGLPLILMGSLLLGLFVLAYLLRRKWKYAELFEGWEIDYGPQRFRFKDLYVATKGFKEKELLGRGGFGKVYRGVMPNSRAEIAVKRVAHDSRQGMREFVAEIASIGRLRHRNLVPLLGYCRRKGELLLVYEYMPNGSLDKFLHGRPEEVFGSGTDKPRFHLNWNQRFQIIKGVAAGILYLHEGWEQVVIHRDIKASNVLLDGEFNPRLGDFGLARLYDHGSDPHTTHVVGTLGYLAPEHARTGKATKNTDVYAFGAFLLEVACGRRPVETRASSEQIGVLVEWVFALWNKGEILGSVDPGLGSDKDYDKEEVEMVLKLGLICSHSRPEMRPSMRQIVLYLDGAAVLPELSSVGLCGSGLQFGYGEGFDDVQSSYPSSSQTMVSGFSSVANSLYYSGR